MLKKITSNHDTTRSYETNNYPELGDVLIKKNVIIFSWFLSVYKGGVGGDSVCAQKAR